MGRRPIGEVAMTGAERTRLYRLKHGTAKPKPAAATIDALREELQEAKAHIQQMALDAAAQAQAFRDEARRRAAQPKPERPPLPPDELRDRRIKALTTENRNLRAKLRDREQRYQRVGGMGFAAESAIAKCLHPDYVPSEAERAEACRLFTSWKADNKAARRGHPNGDATQTEVP
jgi:hypothetical protein